ncbi:alpha/beta fold hydrolase [Luteipulveratus sp. YIM 133132]|uniref:alpha/beta fold hydrolase n=1 Tax=Luteipulveratus flavus TaxID=3031728 RepID=UPI0023AEB71D|nr:alpha/beta fold hydrolase [Luteipulveratus sp. YIM 133132]MDE9367201.1 alpha/beta fold hydrolase [Luteipulveratus sp. YIM 133132]
MIAYELAGTAQDNDPYDVVLLVHAGVADRRMWEPQWQPLTERHRVLRADLPGFGETPLEPGEASFAGTLREVLDQVGARRAAVVASSFGGRVALELAATSPDLVERLVLLAPDVPGAEPSADMRAFGEQEDALLEKGDVAGATELNVRTWLGPEADDAARDLLRAMQQRAFEVQLAADEWDDPPRLVWADTDVHAISARTVVVSGSHDLSGFRERAFDLAARIPGATHRELPWAGHLPNLERPAEITGLLLDVLG